MGRTSPTPISVPSAAAIGNILVQALALWHLKSPDHLRSIVSASFPTKVFKPGHGFVKASDPRFIGTVAAIEKELKRGHNIFRYAAPDDFGLPEAEFLVCRFWLIDALCLLGRKEEARERFADALSLRNQYGLFAEDIHREPRAGHGAGYAR